MDNKPRIIGDVMIPVLWNCLDEHKNVLEDALREAIQSSGGVEPFAQKADVPLANLIMCDWVKQLPPPDILKKIFPYMIPELPGAIDRYMKKRAFEKAKSLYLKYDIENTEDFGNSLKNLINEFEDFSRNDDISAFCNFLCEIIALNFPCGGGKQ